MKLIVCLPVYLSSCELSFLYLRSVVLSLCMPASCIIVCVYQFVCVIPVKYLKPITCLLVCFSVCVCLSVVSIPLTDCLPAYVSDCLPVYLPGVFTVLHAIVNLFS